MIHYVAGFSLSLIGSLVYDAMFLDVISITKRDMCNRKSCQSVYLSQSYTVENTNLKKPFHCRVAQLF